MSATVKHTQTGIEDPHRHERKFEKLYYQGEEFDLDYVFADQKQGPKST